MYTLAIAGEVLGGVQMVLLEHAKADSGRLALKGIITAAAAVASSCMTLDTSQGETSPTPFTCRKRHQQQQQQYKQQKQQQQQHQQQQQRQGEQQQQQQQPCPQKGLWDYAPHLWEVLEDVMVSYTLLCNQPAAALSTNGKTAAGSNTGGVTDARAELIAMRMQPILDLLSVAPDLINYPRLLGSQLLPVGRPNAFEEDLIAEHAPGELSHVARRDAAGAQEVHAVLDAMLLLSQHAPLLPYVLGAKRHMPFALQHCRLASLACYL